MYKEKNKNIIFNIICIKNRATIKHTSSKRYNNVAFYLRLTFERFINRNENMKRGRLA